MLTRLFDEGQPHAPSGDVFASNVAQAGPADVGCSHGNDGATVIGRHAKRAPGTRAKVPFVGLGTRNENREQVANALPWSSPSRCPVRCSTGAAGSRWPDGPAIRNNSLHPYNALGAESALLPVDQTTMVSSSTIAAPNSAWAVSHGAAPNLPSTI